MRRFSIPVALGSLMLGLPTLADVPAARVELTPYVGYRGGGNYLDVVGEADFGEDVTFGAVLNIRSRFNTQWEILYGHQATDIDTSASSLDGSKLELDMDYLHVGGTYLFDGELVRPFLALAFGATRLSPEESTIKSETYFSGSLGTGIRLNLTDQLGLRVEGRIFSLFGKTNSLVFCEGDENGGGCFLAGDGRRIFQYEGSVGVTFRF